MSYRPIGERNEQGFYPAFATSSDEQSRQGLLEAWSTPEQRKYNAATVTCSECRGRGYRVQYKGRQATRENCGCPKCLGLGKVGNKTTDALKEEVA